VGTDVVLRVGEMRLRRDPAPFSIEVRAGEILGLAGLEGHGQAEFTDCLCGLRRPLSGAVEVADAAGRWHSVHGFADANRHGIAYVPRDRKTIGLFPSLSILDNFGIALYPTMQWLGLIRQSALRREFGDYAQLLRLVSGRPSDAVTTLSGGNQQKVLLGRWLATRPRAIVLNDPLRGVDANTKEELYGLFRTLAADGLTIVLLSSEVLELLVLCDRIAVFYEGGLETVLDAEGTAEGDVVRAMFGETGGDRVHG
jgi:ribose transport system ATP-binding protein